MLKPSSIAAHINRLRTSWAALTAVEQRAGPGFDGTQVELEDLLLAGMDSSELQEEEFWTSVDQTTGATFAEHKASVHP